MEQVIILHGIFRTKLSMAWLTSRLKKQGYSTYNITYPSTKLPIEQIVENVREQLARLGWDENIKTNFVCHSMGGLVARAYINKYRPANLGRVVFLGTPNKGSEVADFLKDVGLYKKLYGPAGQQLITDQSAFEEIFGKADFESGVIAGNRRFDIVFGRLIKGESDGKVSVESAKLENMKDMVVVYHGHSMLMYRRDVINHTLDFLKHGEFKK